MIHDEPPDLARGDFFAAADDSVGGARREKFGIRAVERIQERACGEVLRELVPDRCGAGVAFGGANASIIARGGERGVLTYERFVSEDGTSVHVYERYADSAAAVAHLRLFGKKFGGRFVGMVDRKRFTVFGTPSDELRKMLDEFGATYLGPFGGFSK